MNLLLAQISQNGYIYFIPNYTKKKNIMGYYFNTELKKINTLPSIC